MGSLKVNIKRTYPKGFVVKVETDSTGIHTHDLQNAGRGKADDWYHCATNHHLPQVGTKAKFVLSKIQNSRHR
jgi:hypothetical protein